MQRYSLQHLTDPVLRKDLVTASRRRSGADALEIAHIAEFDDRRLYLPEGYPSMHQFCIQVLEYSEDEADTRICVARAAHKFPAVYAMLEDRRLNQTAVLRLAGRLNKDNAEELLAAAAHRTKAQLALLLADRFPQPDMPTLVMEIGPACTSDPEQGCIQPVPERVARSFPRTKVTPLAPHSFGLQFTTGQEAHDLLARAYDLLGHSVRTGDVGEVFVRALRVYVAQLEKRRFAATDKPRPRRASRNPRHIPADIRRAVHARDFGQCTFVSEAGHRCECRRGLQFDHVTPLARGGETTTANIRLLCPAHNQHEADRALGKGFMDEKRRDAQQRIAEARAQKAEADAKRAEARAAAAQVKSERDELLAAAADVTPALKALGARGEDLRLAAKLCAEIPNASQKERILHAIRGIGRANMPRSTHLATSPG